MSKHNLIADKLTEDILRGQYRAGERLPSERDLALKFDANRGSVREAMKKLEQLGIAKIKPGGARVVPLEEASLDVIEPMLDLDPIPNPALVDNIMQVIEGLVQIAVESLLLHATDEQIEDIRSQTRPLYMETLSQEKQAMARFNLTHSIMSESNNLICQLITRSLLLRFAPRLEPLSDYMSVDVDAISVYAKQLDSALAKRDSEAIRAIFMEFSKLNRDSLRRAYEAYDGVTKNKMMTNEVVS